MRLTRDLRTNFSARFMLAVVTLTLLSVAAFAQETRSTILGTVKDPSGAVVAGAGVEVANTDSNTTARVQTNGSGYFEAPYLLPGNYRITATATGVKKSVQQGYVLTVNSRRTAQPN